VFSQYRKELAADFLIFIYFWQQTSPEVQNLSGARKTEATSTNMEMEILF
jgi:hypothetical protein